MSSVFGIEGAMALVVVGLLLVLAEVGYRLGRRLHAAGDKVRRTTISAVEAAILGMMGLLLGFTFSMAIERYDGRRDLVVREANAIRTTWYCADLLPEAYRQPVRGLVAQYVGMRIRSREALRDSTKVAAGLRQSKEIHAKLWQHAEAAARDAPNDITATFVAALNDMIATGEVRNAFGRARIPIGVWLILLMVAAVGCGTSAYHAGSKGIRSPLTSLLLPTLVSLVILLIFDLAHERLGTIGVSQQPLIELQSAIQSKSVSR